MRYSDGSWLSIVIAAMKEHRLLFCLLSAEYEGKHMNQFVDKCSREIFCIETVAEKVVEAFLEGTAQEQIVGKIIFCIWSSRMESVN